MRFPSVLLFALLSVLVLPCANAGDILDNEDITPHIKIQDGPWAGNAVSGGAGAYTIRVQIPRGTRYVLGLFDNIINRSGADARSAVVLVDGVNPLVPSETVSAASLPGADVSSFRKYPLDGVTYIAQDSAGKPASVKVVDAKEEWEVGAVKYFTVPSGRTGSLGRLDVFLFAAPALPPVAGETVAYGAPYLRYTILLTE